MNDLISRQAAIDALTTYIYNVYKAMVGKRMPTDKCRQAAESVIGELPTVQPTIVHCKDCRWNDGTAYCNFHYRDVKGEDFCSWAEKKGESE